MFFVYISLKSELLIEKSALCNYVTNIGCGYMCKEHKIVYFWHTAYNYYYYIIFIILYYYT